MSLRLDHCELIAGSRAAIFRSRGIQATDPLIVTVSEAGVEFETAFQRKARSKAFLPWRDIDYIDCAGSAEPASIDRGLFGTSILGVLLSRRQEKHASLIVGLIAGGEIAIKVRGVTAPELAHSLGL